VEVPDDQRLVLFKRWFKKQPEYQLIGREAWNAAGCDDRFFFCGDIGPDAIIEEMLPIMDEAA
jgi:hypothetical protein